MSIITPPAFNVGSFRWTLKRSEIVGKSVFGSQSIEAATPVWLCSISGVPLVKDEAIAFEQFLESLAGYRNQVEMYHRVQPQPRGTLRGNLTLNADTSEGATALQITGGPSQAGKTLLCGDLIGIGSVITQQVMRIAADATADGSGVIDVSLGTPLRNAFESGVSVVWDRPKALFRQQQNNAGINYVPGIIGEPWSLDLIEDWRP